MCAKGVPGIYMPEAHRPCHVHVMGLGFHDFRALRSEDSLHLRTVQPW